jgi:hypothetical protein
MIDKPLIETQFAVGDLVTYTNDQGVVFPGHKVIRFANSDHMLFKYEKHIHVDLDSYWCPVHERNLTKE